MSRDNIFCILFLTSTLFSTPMHAATIYLTGEVRILDAEVIYTPPSDNSQVVLRYYLPDGSPVKPGDVIVRIDPGQATSQVRMLEAQIDQARSRTEKEVVELRVKLLDAERALIDAEAARDKAKVDAAIPADYIARLDQDRYRSEKERSEREFLLKQSEFNNAKAAIVRRQADAKLEIQKLQLQRDYQKTAIINAEQKATRDGVLTHGFDPWRGGRIDEGSSSWSGQKIGEIVGDGQRGVLAYALEPERRGLKLKQTVSLVFDAYPKKIITGTISKIAAAPDSKSEWGNARYFAIEIDLPEKLDIHLLSGMNVRVQIATKAKKAAP